MTEVVKHSFIFWQNVTKQNMQVYNDIRPTLLQIMFYKNAFIFINMDHW